MMTICLEFPIWLAMGYDRAKRSETYVAEAEFAGDRELCESMRPTLRIIKYVLEFGRLVLVVLS